MTDKQRYAPPPPRALCADVPADLDALCVELLSRDPALRPTGERVLARLGRAPAPEVTQAGRASLFVGRTRELELLRTAWGKACGGETVSVLVEGESGLGKTALVRQFLTTLATSERRVLVLSSRCYERDAASYKAWSGVLERLCIQLSQLEPASVAFLVGKDAASLVRVFPVLRRVPTVLTLAQRGLVIPNPQELRVRAFATLRELFCRLSGERMLVLFLDDLQWADRDSLALLGELLHPPGAPQVLFVATVRTDAGPKEELRAKLDPVERDLVEVQHLRLFGLSPEEGRELAQELVGKEGHAETLAREAAGHPLLLHELACHAVSAESQASGIHLDEVLWERVKRLERPARKLLEVIAVADAPLPLSTIVHAASVNASSASRWVGLLGTANLVRGTKVRGLEAVQPFHDRVRETVLAHLDEAARAGHHLRLALALERDGTASSEPQVLVRHLEAAGETSRAAALALRAAATAGETLAFDRAAMLCRAALRLGGFSGEAARRIKMQLAEALVNGGRGAEAAEAYLEASEGADEGTRLECRRKAMEHFLTSGHLERGLVTARRVLGELGTGLPTSRRRALLSLLWHRLRLRARGLRFRKNEASAVAAEVLAAIDTFRGVGAGLGVVDTVCGHDFLVRALLRALRAGEPVRVAALLYVVAIGIALTGRRSGERARVLIHAADEISQTSQEPYLAGLHWSSQGFVSYTEGEFPAALQALREGELIFRDRTTGTAWLLGTTRLFRLWALRHAGGIRELQVVVDEYLRDATRRGDRYMATTVTRVSTLVWLARDAPSEARQELEHRSWTPPDKGYHTQHWYELRASGEIALYAGTAPGLRPASRPSFDGLSRSLLLHIQIIRAESRWLEGRLALAEAEAGIAARRALADAQRFARKLERERTPYIAVWALLLRAGIAAKSGDPRLPDLLRAALSAAEALSMLLCAHAARRRLGETLGATEGAAMIAQADAWMAKEGIRNPARMVEVVAPGFAAKGGHDHG